MSDSWKLDDFMVRRDGIKGKIVRVMPGEPVIYGVQFGLNSSNGDRTYLEQQGWRKSGN